MKFSIGIPAYKARFLKECINSILAQTYTDFELIIVNDASPENIKEIVLQYSDPRISYYENEKNSGAENIVDNWNKCLILAKGEYFILIGDDDKMAPDYLDTFISLINRHPQLNIFHCRAYIIDENSEIISITSSRPEIESVYDSILQRMRNNRIFFISDYVYKTEELKHRGGFYKLPLAWASDDISAYIASQKYGIAHTEKPVFLYRKSSITISAAGNFKLKIDAIIKEGQWLTDFLSIIPDKEIDKVLRDEIKKELKKYIQKKKIITLSRSFMKNKKNYIKSMFIRKQLGLSFLEVTYALFNSILEIKKNKRY